MKVTGNNDEQKVETLKQQVEGLPNGTYDEMVDALVKHHKDKFRSRVQQVASTIIDRKFDKFEFDELRRKDFPSNGRYAMMDTGADRSVVSSLWRIVKVHPHKIIVNGKRLPCVDAVATFVHIGKKGQQSRPFIMKVSQAVYDKDSLETILAPDQMMWNGLDVDCKAFRFGGKQEIKGPDFTIPLYWNGQTYFFHVARTKDSEVQLKTVAMTGNFAYDPRKRVKVFSIASAILKLVW